MVQIPAHKQDQHDGDNDKYVDQILSDGDAATEPPLLCRPSSPSTPQVIFSNIIIVITIITIAIINILILSKTNAERHYLSQEGDLDAAPTPTTYGQHSKVSTHWVIVMVMMSTYDLNLWFVFSHKQISKPVELKDNSMTNHPTEEESTVITMGDQAKALGATGSHWTHSLESDED